MKPASLVAHGNKLIKIHRADLQNLNREKKKMFDKKHFEKFLTDQEEITMTFLNEICSRILADLIFHNLCGNIAAAKVWTV